MSAKRVPLRIRVVAAALAVAALVGGLASTETAASAGRGLLLPGAGSNPSVLRVRAASGRAAV